MNFHVLLLWPNLELGFQALAPSIRKLLRLDFAPMDARACACQGPASFPPRAQDSGGLGRGERFSNQEEEHLTLYISVFKIWKDFHT
ncbi:hypothetical protein D5086_030278 [Populus alba]|uniref:Uncharacterized protein n=1 Tax=Populus alba TaxID=43335 RepID=A0ACC4AN30_POPAL